MGTIENTIKDLLIDTFDPSMLYVINESNMHNVPVGSESHFKVVIVSNNFTDIKNIQRHQEVYKALKDVMNSIHALSIHTYNESEYQNNPQTIDSPNCVNKRNES
ncbi:MAG: transcriptional regulator BolA [Gammaproteobacteria bacterium]|nr:transcriptional regulator BolA [Gammaproteobacteria bacterium]|tara:strand:- start:1152 stop:1466 length:315 start_codon:yes stop_codon:yes gene_type:complete